MSKGVYRRGKIWWITYLGLDGRQRWESSKSTKKSDAEYMLACRRKDLGEGRQPIPQKRMKNYSFSELADKYKEFAKFQKGYSIKKLLVDMLVREFGDILLRNFNLMILEQYQTKCLEEKKKPATINRRIATLKHMFTKAEEWEMVDADILKKVRRVKQLAENNRRLRFLSVEECRELVAACGHQVRVKHLQPMVIMALNTGMRRGEILKLTWDQVDMKHGFILLEDTNTKNGSRREIPINSDLREALRSLTRRLDTPLIFFDPNSEAGKAKPYQDIRTSFYRACKRAGILDFHFHDLRHTFASQLVMGGVDLTTVKELLGHKDIKMTLRYAHLAPAHKARAVEILQEKIGSGVHDKHMTTGDSKREKG